MADLLRLSMMENHGIWITWELQRRNRELSKALCVKFFELSEIGEKKNLFKKYLLGILKTGVIIFKEKPKVVFAQNPSIVLSLLVILMKPFARFKVCIDAHNAGVFPKEGKSRMLGAIARWIQKRADLTIVTNEGLRKHVNGNGGRAFILQDKIPSIPTVPKICLKGKFNILFICTYASDEPYMEVFSAFQEISRDVFLYVTGNYRKRKIDRTALPENIILMGFIPEDEYITMLNSVNATMILTEREDCLVCGAYESISVGKPMILSDTQALRDYFQGSAVYTKNTAEGIKKAVVAIVERRGEIEKSGFVVREFRTAEWEKKKNALIGSIFYPGKD
jgi:glycosyltransferase involved in cell wall biosynthesis